ncbi:MAG: WbqC family protein [Pseudomonadota bacterium]
MTRVAIMQPTYLPWSGYFGLMQSVDLFVLLDTVQFARRSWQQRNQIKTANGPIWLSVPVRSKGKRYQLIRDVEIERDAPFAHDRTVALNYAKASYYADFGPDIVSLLGHRFERLIDLNEALINHLRRVLGIETEIVRASRFEDAGAKADRLAHICRQVGAREYVSPPGSKAYVSGSDAFDAIGVAVRYFAFDHPEHPQLFGPFDPYMSVIDLILNCGSEGAQMIRSASALSS